MSLSQAYIDARHATALHLLINGVDLAEINGHVAKSLIQRGFLQDRRPNDSARSWLSRYNGRIASEKAVKRKQDTVRRANKRAAARVDASPQESSPAADKIRAARARLMIEEICNHPQDWLFVSRSAAHNCDLDATALGVLVFLGILRDRAGADVSISALASRFPELGPSGVRSVVSTLHAAGFVMELSE